MNVTGALLDVLCCRKLEEALSPSVLNIVNESHLHAGHMGNPSGAPDAETHFK
jgi:BolA protein